MKHALFLCLCLAAHSARAFCGFYVARADAKLFNEASQVVLARHGDQTVITMSNDFQGDLTEFATVIPVPEVPAREQIAVAERRILDHLDAYTAPRLVEYFDGNPCRRWFLETLTSADGGGTRTKEKTGVTIEATYTVGEYDILILSATQSTGLETWLTQNGYRLPQGATEVLGSYIRQDMKFFVAKVNLAEQAKTGFTYLRPLQVRYNSPKFMLPIRLGTVNAAGPQELLIYLLAQEGRAEIVNYRTVNLPTDLEVPLFVKEAFGEFYKAMFYELARQNEMKTAFLEYAWDMNWCDPCAADPMAPEDLIALGATWITPQVTDPNRPKAQARDAYVTRLHLRYTAETFPEDLAFQVTGNRENFQARYILRHPWKLSAADSGMKIDSFCLENLVQYSRNRDQLRLKEAQNLSSLTGWDVHSEILPRMDGTGIQLPGTRTPVILPLEPGEVRAVYRMDGTRAEGFLEAWKTQGRAPGAQPGLYLFRLKDGGVRKILVP